MTEPTSAEPSRSPGLRLTTPAELATLDFDKGGGLVVVVAQHAASGAVLMVAFADEEALRRSLETKELHLRSRRRGLWRKGETSGNVLAVVELLADCDGDAVLARVVPKGPTCHTGAPTCFGAPPAPPEPHEPHEPSSVGTSPRDAQQVTGALSALAAVIDARAAALAAELSGAAQGAEVDRSYTRRLLADRNLRLKKLGEEAVELVVALADEDRERAAEEAADLVYHTLVALRGAGLSLSDVERVLERRASEAQKRER
jgi:phosphoribosyl-ATP pyrophosphohydrolase/phosphoribosyl-AMP cyclohydrolase